jgi:outer membrane lipoprotein SlyB
MLDLRSKYLALALLAPLAGCGPSYSPDTYATSAVQQANKVEQGVIVGVRPVGVAATGVVGAAAGGAAGGIIGSQAGPGLTGALGAVGGSLVGSLVGTTVEHAQGDTTAWEYVVKETKGDLISVTQKGDAPMSVGQKVLVIAGAQARIVPDYTVVPEGPGPTAAASKEAAAPVAPLAPIIVTPLPTQGAATPATASAGAPIPLTPQVTTPPPPPPAAIPPAPLATPVPADNTGL